MEKKIILTKQGNKKVMEVAIIIALGPKQLEKLQHNDLADRIDALCADLHVDFSISEEPTPIINITRDFDGEISSADMHNLEMDATVFMGAIEKMEIATDVPADETKAEQTCLNDEEKDLLSDFLEDVSDDVQTSPFIIRADITMAKFVDDAPILIPVAHGRIGHSTLVKVLKLALANG